MDEIVSILKKNIADLDERKGLCDNSRKFWITDCIRTLCKNGVVSFSQTSESLIKAGAYSVDDFLVAAGELRSHSLFELHADISLGLNENRPKIISYFRNNLSQKAFIEFFSDEKCEIIERESYGDIFEDVYNERAFYCIVPIENTSSGKLLNFYSLIANYNLKICKVCDVEHQGQEASTKFALLTAAPIAFPAVKDINCSFEISVSAANGSSLSRIIEAASKCGMLAKRIDSIPFEHLKNEYYYNIVFSLENNSEPFDFLCFLSLDGITYTPIGIY